MCNLLKIGKEKSTKNNYSVRLYKYNHDQIMCDCVYVRCNSMCDVISVLKSWGRVLEGRGKITDFPLQLDIRNT